MASTAQINVRLDAGAKHGGDAALAKAGITPSQAVRALWDLAARNAETPRKLIAILFPDRISDEAEAAKDARARKLELIEQGANMVEAAYRASGISWPPADAELSYEKLKESAYVERFGDMMGWTNE